MKTRVWPGAAGLFATASALAQPIVLPASYASASGGVSPADTLTREFPRTHQQIISASELSSLPIGASITQITFRASNSGTANTLGSWPAANLSFADFEIYLAKAATTPATMTTTLASNIVAGSEVRVRDGALSVPAASYSNYVAAPGANPWGLDVQVTPFVYSGGDLVITIRHSGHGVSGTARLYEDSLANTGTLTRCMAATSQTATVGAPDQSLPVIFRIRYTAPPGCYANCDHSTASPFLNTNDYLCFLNLFAAGLSLPAAQQATAPGNCDGSTMAPAMNIIDFVCFNNRFATGCTAP